MANITIVDEKGKKKDYTIKFDYLSIRKFGKAVGMNKPSELEVIFNSMDLEDPSFKDIDTIAYLVHSAIKHAKVPTFEIVLNSLLADPDGISKVFEELNSSTDVDVTEENKNEEVKN